MSDSDIEIVEEDTTFETMTKSYQTLLTQIENGFGGWTESFTDFPQSFKSDLIEWEKSTESLPNVEVFQSAWTQFLLTLSALLRAQSTINGGSNQVESMAAITAEIQEKSVHNFTHKSSDEDSRATRISTDIPMNLTKSQSIWSPARSLENETLQNFSIDRRMLINNHLSSLGFSKNRREPKEEPKIFPVSYLGAFVKLFFSTRAGK